jgi:hypothetical protein
LSFSLLLFLKCFLVVFFTDASSERLLKDQGRLQQQQEEVFKNLQRINSTVMDVMATVLGLQTQMEHRITWITQLLGGTGEFLWMCTSMCMRFTDTDGTQNYMDDTRLLLCQ